MRGLKRAEWICFSIARLSRWAGESTKKREFLPKIPAPSCWAALLFILFSTVLTSLAESGSVQLQATEAQVKAAYLFNFGKYVTWPQTTKQDFPICILGQDPLGSALDAIIAGEKIGNRPVEIRRIRDAQQSASCSVVYVSISEESRLASTLEFMKSTPALTVSDIPHFVDRGGMIQLVVDGNRVRFIVNLAATQRVGLGLSSELLKVAKVVTRENTGREPK
jgi:hypothetical protein